MKQEEEDLIMGITDPLDPLKCYCGRPTKIYDSLFRRNFCSDECSTDLRIFLGGTDQSIKIKKEINEVKAGDFTIRGSVVTFGETLQQHTKTKAASIDQIDAKIQSQLADAKIRDEMKRKFPNMPDSVIDAMIKAKG